MKCAYHSDNDAVGACVNCGKFICVECKAVLGGKIYCNPCVDKMFLGSSIPRAQDKEEVTYNTALRVISGTFGIFFILSAITGLSYYAESGLARELIVDIVTLITATACFLMAFIPQWVSANLTIKLKKGPICGLTLSILVVVVFVAIGLGPEPSGGWWNY